ncbi:MAG TPA: AAA family ATPase [Acidimicrobiales bacterium]|nr:AAA family ATPase [Acidimicrobiales bacterium]
MSAPALPTWARELLTLLPACSHFLLSGNVHDQYLVAIPTGEAEAAGGGTPARVLLPLPQLLAEVLRAQGIDVVVSHDISVGASTVPDTPEAAARAEELLGSAPGEVAPQGSLRGLAQLIERLSDAAEPAALIIRSASRLARDITQLSDAEFEFYRTVDRLARNSRPAPDDIPGTTRSVFSPIIWLLENERDVPSWFALHNEFLRSIVLPLPHTGERRELANRLVPMLAEASPEQVSGGARVLTEQMAGMPLVAMQRSVAIARDQGLGPDRIEDAARSYRVGVTDNPWRAPYLTERLRNEVLVLSGDPAHASTPSALATRVLGQDLAVRKALDILVRSATGLTAAQAGPTATRPRGVLFFAGPTGVGKTELAKALTKLLFDDERFYIRFDMSEFSAEHAAARLIGAPPGYRGYDTGGELTNAIRQRPFSLVLFDEIEKAHPRILDKFLQLLDDGRLTDGRGQTVFFTEAVIVFTSNLGIYADVEERDESGALVRRRRPTVDRHTMSYDEMAARIQHAIRDYFTLQLERPELLNRLGDNVVVFDFIDAATGERILDLMLGNVMERVRQEHRVEIELAPESRELLLKTCLNDDTLALGGRGIGSMLETAFINPLANQLFLIRLAAGAPVVLEIAKEGSEWTATLRPA